MPLSFMPLSFMLLPAAAQDPRIYSVCFFLRVADNRSIRSR